MSGASKSNPTQGAVGAGWVGAGVLNIYVPLLFIVTGIAALLGAIGLIFLRPEVLTTYHYNQYVIAITHLVVLGWLGSVVMGAMYQLVPVALETKLYSQKLAAIQFALHLVGFCGMVWMFWTWNMKQVGHFGSILGVGVLLFIYNLFRTLFRVPRWNVAATGIASTLFWLALTVSVGLMVAAGKCSYDIAESTGPATWQTQLVWAVSGIGKWVARFDQMGVMHAHAHAGVVGFFLMLIVGVSYRLVPMFTLSEIQKPRRAMASVLLLNLGLAGAFWTILVRSQYRFLFSATAVLGLVLYGFELRAILRARKRRVIDWAVKYFLTGLLKKTSGSRTYPVEYTYDAQGRMKTMKPGRTLPVAPELPRRPEKEKVSKGVGQWY
jgi:cbb3-type cytochrome oxidase subunit 1